MDTFSPLDIQTLSDESTKVVDFIINYYKNIENYPVQSQVEPGYLRKLTPKEAPFDPEPLATILEDIERDIIPGLTHWQSPNFYAYFQGNASNAAFLGEMLCAGLNVVGFNWISSPAATELENIVVDWMGKLLTLPREFLFSGNGGGVLHGSTCEALVCTLAAARDRALKRYGADSITKFVIYSSDQTHFSLHKAAKLVGFNPSNFRVIRTLESVYFGLSPEDLKVVIEKDLECGLVPLYLCATIGATGSGAVDPLKELGIVSKRFGLWFHIDAAYAGSACICPEYQYYLEGVELADSFSMNAHKWFLTNMDCCCLWVKNPADLIYSLSTSPDILKKKATESKRVVDYKDWKIALSRKFRAIKLWVVLRMYGVANLIVHIRSDVELAKHFEALVRSDVRFEVVVPTKFSLVCLRIRNVSNDEKGTNDMNIELLDMLNRSGRAFMVGAVLNGKFVIRCAIGGSLTEKRHIDGLWKLIQEKVYDLLVSKELEMAKNLGQKRIILSP